MVFLQICHSFRLSHQLLLKINTLRRLVTLRTFNQSDQTQTDLTNVYFPKVYFMKLCFRKVSRPNFPLESSKLFATEL